MRADEFDVMVTTLTERRPFRPYTIVLFNDMRYQIDYPLAITVREGFAMHLAPRKDPGLHRPRRRLPDHWRSGTVARTVRVKSGLTDVGAGRNQARGAVMNRKNFEDSIRMFQARTPYRPFTIYLINGHRFEVDHPGAILVRNGTGVYVEPGGAPVVFDYEGVGHIVGDLAAENRTPDHTDPS